MEDQARDPELTAIYNQIRKPDSIKQLKIYADALALKCLKREMTELDSLSLLTFTRIVLTTGRFKGLTLAEIQKEVVKAWMKKQMQSQRVNDVDVDMHEDYLKPFVNQVDNSAEYKFGTSVLNDGGGTITINPNNNTVTIANKNAYLEFDSKYRDLSVNVWRWNANYTGTPNAGSVMISDSYFGNIYEMEVMGPFSYPLQYNDDYFKEITMEIQEVNKQGYQDPTGFRYHFTFVPHINGNRVFLVPKSSVYRFSVPITTIASFTFILRNADVPIIPPVDNVLAIPSFTNPAVFTTSVNHGLLSGDAVYFSNFIVSLPAPNAAIDSAINSPTTPWKITRLSNNTFSIPYDLSTVTAIANNVQCYLGAYRSEIRIRMGYITV